MIVHDLLNRITEIFNKSNVRGILSVGHFSIWLFIVHWICGNSSFLKTWKKFNFFILMLLNHFCKYWFGKRKAI